MQGNELADDYIRKSVPNGRWGDAWDVFKNNFSKIIMLNLLVLVTFIPSITLMFFRSTYFMSLGSVYPVNSSIPFFFYPELVGQTESVAFSVDVMFYGILVISGLFAAVGIAGGVYSMKKLLITHGDFSFKGFLHGIRKCYFNTVLPVLLVLFFIYGTVLLGDWRAFEAAVGGSVAGATTAYVFAIVATVLVGIYAAWLLATGCSYKLGFIQLIKNSFVLMIGAPIHTIFMAGFSLIPVWLMFMGSFFRTVGIVLFIFFGFAYIILCWVSFTQWEFDMYITPNLAVAEKEKNAQKTPKQLAEEKLEEERRTAMELLAAGRSELIARPIKPVSDQKAITPFGKTFSRENLKKASSEREALYKDVKDYEKLHENDQVYVDYNKMFSDREKALQTPTDKKGKKSKKRVSSDNLLH